jgi:uncharacterized protein YdeI (YjbR/CyaY-like superfamily)
MNPKVDLYILDGCGRCAYHATPKCKVRNWQEVLETLRQVVLDCGLTEELKWGVPCYTVDGKNVLIVSALKNYCGISFFKGVLLDDPHGILEKPGANSQSYSLIKFTKVEEITEREEVLKSYILQAVEVEKAGLKVEFKPDFTPMPDELLQKFEEFPAFKKAFFALTKGRQKGYIIYFSQPKQSQTKVGRIEKSMQQIFNGKGLNDK